MIAARQSFVPLTVWDPNSHAAYVVKNDIFTWQAWNEYGGYDFYAGIGQCPVERVPDLQSGACRVVRPPVRLR